MGSGIHRWIILHSVLKKFPFSEDTSQGPVDDETVVNVILHACTEYHGDQRRERYVFKGKITSNLSLEFKLG